MQINLNTIDWKKVMHYAITFILCFLLFSKCAENKELQRSSFVLQKEAAQHKTSAQKHVDAINALQEEVSVLETKKQKVKTEIVYLEKKTKATLEKVPSLSTKEIASYYENRYKKPATITPYGVALKDSVAKENIKETIEKDGCFEEMKLIKKGLAIEESKSSIKDSINSSLTKAYSALEKANSVQAELIQNTEKSLKKERIKKTFWQITTGAIIGSAAYFVIAK